MMPMAGEDAVADAATVQREAHMRAAVVDRVEPVAVGDHGDAVAASRDDARLIQLFDSSDANEPIGGHSHGNPLSRVAARRHELTHVSSS